MNILMIGNDSSVLTQKKGSLTNTIVRNELISKDITKISVAILVNTGKFEKIIVSNKINAYRVPFKGLISLNSVLRNCSKICVDEDIDIISVQGPFFASIIGYLLKRKHSIPLNIQIHGDFIDNPWWIRQRKTHFLWNKWAKWVLKRSDSVRTVNPEIKEHLVDIGINAHKIIDFPVFIEINKFTSSAIDLKYKFQNYENIILFVGFLIPRKGVDTLLKAIPTVLNTFPNSLFLIVGDGEQRKNLEKLSTDLKISKNVIFKGNIPFESVASFFKTCDIFVLPSRSESWGRVVIEAMLFKKPVIISSACKISSILTKTNSGIIFKVDNHEDLAKKIIFLIKNKEVADKMGNAGKDIVTQNYSETVIIPKYYEMWEKTLKKAEK